MTYKMIVKTIVKQANNKPLDYLKRVQYNQYKEGYKPKEFERFKPTKKGD